MHRAPIDWTYLLSWLDGGGSSRDLVPSGLLGINLSTLAHSDARSATAAAYLHQRRGACESRAPQNPPMRLRNSVSMRGTLLLLAKLSVIRSLVQFSLIIGFGAVLGTSVFIMIGTHFRQIFDRWALTRHCRLHHELLRPCAAPPFDEHYPHVLDCSSFPHHRCGVVLHKGDRCTRHFPASSIPYASGPVDFDHTDIDRRLGCPRSSMIAAFAFAGLAQSDGLTLSILYGATSFVVGVIGGIVWIASGLRVRSFDQAVANSEAVTDNP